jgi:hypothetical protein
MKKILLFLFVSVFAIPGQSQNVNLSNYAFFDAEPFIAVNPTNPNNVIAAWIKITTFTTAQIAVVNSQDGGVTWSAPQNMPHFSSTYTSADPSIDFNSSGKAFLTYVDYKQTLDSGKVLLVSSTDGGQNWSAANPVTDGLETPDLPVDRPWVGVDRSGGTYNGRVYVTTINVETGSTTNHVYLKYSQDDGITWSPLIVIDDSIPADLVRTGNAMAIGADGSVNLAYASWHLPASLAARIIMVKSVNGGQSFIPYVMGNIPANTAINDTLQGSTTLSANPVNAQNLIFTYTSNINGDADILSINSQNGGVTWSNSSPVRVNDDALSNGNQQDMSWGGFAPNGTYVVGWRDRRNGGTSVVSPFEIWVAASTDAGLTFETNHMVSSVLSPDIPVPKGNDFIGVSPGSVYLHTNWCDNRTGNYEIFYNRDSLSTIVNVQEQINTAPSIVWNTDNSTGNIVFRYNLGTDLEKSTIDIIDVNGRVVRSVFQGTQSRGPHEVYINNETLSPGNYVFRVSAVGWTAQTKFVTTF